MAVYKPATLTFLELLRADWLNPHYRQLALALYLPPFIPAPDRSGV